MEFDASKNEENRELRDENRLMKLILDAIPQSIFAKDLGASSRAVPGVLALARSVRAARRCLARQVLFATRAPRSSPGACVRAARLGPRSARCETARRETD